MININELIPTVRRSVVNESTDISYSWQLGGKTKVETLNISIGADLVKELRLRDGDRCTINIDGADIIFRFHPDGDFSCKPTSKGGKARQVRIQRAGTKSALEKYLPDAGKLSKFDIVAKDIAELIVNVSKKHTTTRGTK